MDKHITLVAVLNIGLGAMGIVAASIVFIILAASGILSRDPQAMKILPLIGSIVAVFLIVISTPAIVAGIGLLRRCSWARILVLIVAVLNLLNFPLGTMLAIYTIWVMLQDETLRLLSPRAKSL